MAAFNASKISQCKSNESLKILNDDGLRNRHEFVYHKILDCLGDIMLSGNRIFGHIKTSQGGHELTNKLLKKFPCTPIHNTTFSFANVYLIKVLVPHSLKNFVL